MKNFFGNIFRNKNLVTIIAFAVCIVIILLMYNYRVNQKTKTIAVPYAKTSIPARTEITDNMVGTIKMPLSMVTSGVVRTRNNIVGKYVNYNTYIPSGSLFYASVLVDWNSMPDSAWSNIDAGNTIVSLSVNVNTTYGNSIFPGDKIDLYYKSIDNDKLVLGKLIEGIEVLAVKDSNGAHIFKKGPEQQQASALIFSVTEELHLLLRKAMYLNGEIIPVPRNATYGEEATISSAYLKSFILSQTVEIPLDEEEEEGNIDITIDNNQE